MVLMVGVGEVIMLKACIYIVVTMAVLVLILSVNGNRSAGRSNSDGGSSGDNSSIRNIGNGIFKGSNDSSIIGDS